jgi:hypothetical protein
MLPLYRNNWRRSNGGKAGMSIETRRGGEY